MVDYFKDFKKYAFRLELLQNYNVDEEIEPLKEFAKTGKINKSVNKNWGKIIKLAVKRNARIQRIHVIDFPLSDYIKFEIEAYKMNKKLGEEIFLIDKNEFDKLNIKINHDFWLFDGQTVLKMNYDNNSKFLGFQKIAGEIKKFIRIRDLLLSKSKPL